MWFVDLKRPKLVICQWNWKKGIWADILGMGWSLYTCSGFGVFVCKTEICDMKILSSMEPHAPCV